MSYILDALNKAEKDRQQQPPTSVPSVSTQRETVPQTRGKYGLYVIIIALVLLILGVLLNKSETPLQQAAIPQKEQVTSPKAESTIQSKVVKTQPTHDIEKDASYNQKKVMDIPNIMALGSTLRNQLPPIVISAHVYSEEVGKRMVIINNQVKHEQQYIGEQLQLTHITPQGIQLQYQGTAFTMKVKDQWPPY
jgi:hypothetical protein